MTLKVLALTRYGRLGASSRVRFLQYIPQLESCGIRVHVEPLLSDDYLSSLYSGTVRPWRDVVRGILNRFRVLIAATDAQVLWLQREVIPFLPFPLEQLLVGGRPLVIDFDDAHHLYYREGRSGLVQLVLGDKTDRLMRAADAVVVGNPALKTYAQSVKARHVFEIPSAVDVSAYEDAAINWPPTPTFGWIGTPVTAARTLPIIEAPLRRVMAETGARCVLIGAGDKVCPDLPAERRPWSEAAEAGFFKDISIGLCPLEDSAWSRGKSGYKIIQYMAAGRACIGSPVGIAENLIRPEVTGFHCDTEDEWTAAMTRLVTDQSMARAFGQEALKSAEADYDVTVAGDRLAKILKQVAA